MKEETDNSIVVGDFNTPLSSRQKSNKETLDLNQTLGKMVLADRYRHISSNRSRMHSLLKCIRAFSRIDHIEYKTSLSKFKKIETIPSLSFLITVI